MINRTLEQHWKMCHSLRHNPSKLGAKAAEDYFGLRKVMKVSDIERKALLNIKLPGVKSNVR